MAAMRPRTLVRIGLVAALAALAWAAWLAFHGGAADPVPPAPPPLTPRPRDEVATFSQILIGYQRPDGKSANARSHAEAETLANELVARLKAGARMEELISKYTDDRKDDGSVFNDGTYTLARKGSPALPVVKAAVFALKPGQLYPEPVETGFAFLVLRRDS